MKRVLPLVLMFIALQSLTLLHAQGNSRPESCQITSAGLNILDTAYAGNNCTARADVYFVAKIGPNQKFFTGHIWERKNYPNISYSPPGRGVPTAQELGMVLRTIVIERVGQGAQGGQEWRFASAYPLPGVTIDNSGLTLRVDTVPSSAGGLYDAYKGYVFFRISGVSLTIPGFCKDASIAVDIWGSNANNNNAVNCVNRDVSVFDCMPGTRPVISGNIVCNTPQAYSLRFNNAEGCLPYFISYDAFADINNNGRIDAGDLNVVPDVDGDGEPDDYAVLFPGQDSITPLAAMQGAQNANLLVVATAYTFGNMAIESIVYDTLAITSGCSVLPVRFSSFSAVRNSQNKQLVSLQWETAQEQINKGFHVQRNTGGAWTNVAFVPSQAEGGNSTAALRYSFNDMNSFNNITQYRLLQEDLDGRFSYSDVKAIRGLGQQASIIIYPNPGQNGKVNVMFADVQAVRDVFVADMSGRIVKQYREVAGNSLQVDGLNTGFYTIRVVDKKTNEVKVEKLVIQ